jgi:LDH2 family malate/lactate/ureidoglycolate dehydrogenase
VPQAFAERIAECIVLADLRGVSTHGVFRVATYLKRLRLGLFEPNPAIVVERVGQAVAAIDGGNSFGMVVATRAKDAAIAIACETGIGMAAVRRSTHFGMAACYPMQAIAAGMIGIVWTNASPALPPRDGRAPFFGTSPMAHGVPAGEEEPFLLDMAMTVLARGSVFLAKGRGERIPEGLALDAEGRPTSDPDAFLADSSMLAFGGVKGASLSFLMDILAGVLTGAAFAGKVPQSECGFRPAAGNEASAGRDRPGAADADRDLPRAHGALIREVKRQRAPRAWPRS